MSEYEREPSTETNQNDYRDIWSGWPKVGVILELDEKFEGVNPNFSEEQLAAMQELLDNRRPVVN